MKQSVVNPTFVKSSKAISRKVPFLVKQVLAAGIVLGSFFSSAQAALITYNFAGQVNSVSPEIAGTFNTSQTMSGSFTYESTTAGFLCGGCSESNGFSDYAGAVKNFTMTIGGYTATPPFGTPPGTSSAVNLQVANNWFGNDALVIASRLAGTQLNGFNPLALISLNGLSIGGFSSTSLLTVGDLTGIGGSFYLAFSASGSEPNVRGTITSVSNASSPPVSVPAPGVLMLMMSGFAMMSFTRRRKTGDTSAPLSRS